jgi:hypothetical protein
MPENNDCQPIVIYPLGVACQVTNPSDANTSNGTATLIVTGGTPPYNITWGNGNTSFAINNLFAGTYPATIVDYYGDFTANTVCTLTAPVVPTTTTTTTIIPIPTYELCMTIESLYRNSKVNLQIHFIPNGVVNGKQSWISDDSVYTLIWDNVDNRWELVDTVNNFTIINNDPTYPPLNGWVMLGNEGEVTVVEGECKNTENLSLNVSTNSPECTGCDGSISIEGSGGVPPYQYSINGGLTWSSNPLFQELCPSVTYSPQIKDSEGTIVVSQMGNVTFTPKLITGYTISLNLVSTVNLSSTSKEYTYVFNITPSLPNDGTTIMVDINFSAQFFQRPYITSASKSFTSFVIKNGNTIPSVDNDVVNTVTSSNPCSQYLTYITTFNREYNGLTINATDVYSITLITDYELTCSNPPPALLELQTPEPTPLPNDDNVVDNSLGPLKFDLEDYGTEYSCCIGYFKNLNYGLNNPTITGCQCCTVTGFQYFFNRS